MGPFSFGMLLTLGPRGRLCPFALLNGSSWAFFGAVWEDLSGRREEVTGSPQSLDLHRPNILLRGYFKMHFLKSGTGYIIDQIRKVT